MATFTDTQKRNWTIVLTLGSALRVKDALGVDLLQPEAGDPPLLQRLGTDELLTAQVICCLLADQIERHGVTEAQVRDAFDGSTLAAAHGAFYEALADFFQGRGRPDRAQMVTAQQRVIAAATAKLDEAVTQVAREAIERVAGLSVDALIAGATSGESPAPSGSTPGP